MLNWEEVRSLPHRQRNATVEILVREALEKRLYSDRPLTTLELAAILLGCDDPPVGRPRDVPAQCRELSQRLTRLAPFMPAYARHDGETVKRYGHTMRRWQWYGQRYDTQDKMRDECANRGEP